MSGACCRSALATDNSGLSGYAIANPIDPPSGEAFLLQDGDCAENFSDCRATTVTNKLKILLQMSLVLVHGLKMPVIRVGRIAGQYAKPRSSDLETRGGQSLPSYRGDLINGPEFTEEARRPDPTRLLRGYGRAAMTLNFIRSLSECGFADLHHPENWDLEFMGHSAQAADHAASRVFSPSWSRPSISTGSWAAASVVCISS